MILLLSFPLNQREKQRERERERENASSLAVKLAVLVSGQVFFTKKKVYSS